MTPAETTVAQILAKAEQETRDQPWKEVLANAEKNADKASESNAKKVQELEPIKTGGAHDVLTSFFTA
jgi:hypothetical protein